MMNIEEESGSSILGSDNKKVMSDIYFSINVPVFQPMRIEDIMKCSDRQPSRFTH